MTQDNRSEFERRRDELAITSHDMIDDQLALKWEYVAAFSEGYNAGFQDPLVEAMERALESINEELHAMGVYEVKEQGATGGAQIGIYIDEVLAAYREAKAKVKESKP